MTLSRRQAALGSLALLAVACKGDQPVEGEVPSDKPESWELVPWGAAGWDPLEAWGSESGVEAAVVLAADGSELPTQAFALPSGEVATWVPSQDLVPGAYTLRAPGDASVTLAHTVLPYGQVEGLEVAGLAGRTWAYDTETGDFSAPDGVGSLFIGQVGGLWLHAEEAAGDEVLFAVVIQGTGDKDPCRVLRLRATVDETGQLWWSQDALDAATEPDPLALSNLFLHGGALEGAVAWGGVEGGLTVETSALDAMVNADLEPGENRWDTCGLVAGLGVECWDCAELGATCLDLVFHAAVFEEVDAVAWTLDELPACGADLSEVETPDFDFDCDFSGFSCSVLAFGLMGGVGWRRRRRRPGEG